MAKLFKCVVTPDMSFSILVRGSSLSYQRLMCAATGHVEHWKRSQALSVDPFPCNRKSNFVSVSLQLVVYDSGAPLATAQV